MYVCMHACCVVLCYAMLCYVNVMLCYVTLRYVMLCVYIMFPHTHTHMHAHAHGQARTHAHTHTCTHARADAPPLRTQRHTQTHTHTHRHTLECPSNDRSQTWVRTYSYARSLISSLVPGFSSSVILGYLQIGVFGLAPRHFTCRNTGRYIDWRPNLLHGVSTAVFVGSRTVDSLLPPAFYALSSPW